MLHVFSEGQRNAFFFLFRLKCFCKAGAPVVAPAVEEAKVKLCMRAVLQGRSEQTRTEPRRWQWGGKGACLQSATTHVFRNGGYPQGDVGERESLDAVSACV